MIGLWGLMMLLVAVIHAASGQTNGTQSGCELCARTGDCSRAYHGAQGQFCGNWLDRQNERRPCCCPDDSVCKVSNYACNCGYVPYRAGGGSGDGLLWLWWLLGALALVLCCGGCCFMMFRRSKERDADSAIPIAAPVPSSITGGSSSQPYGTAYASAPPEPVYAAATPVYGRHYGQSGGGGMGAGTGAALGGTAGLLGGLVLGEMLADHGDGGGFGDGGFDDGGGFDGGDFGGDF